MDALFHLIFSLAGGFILSENLKTKNRVLVIPLLSILSLFPDIEHIISASTTDSLIRFHGLYIILIPLTAYLVLEATKKHSETKKNLLIFTVMITGHLIMDTVSGMYGVYLLYPFNEKTYLIPKNWEIYLLGDETKPLASTYGIGAAIYFGLVFTVSLTAQILSSKDALKKTDTRK